MRNILVLLIILAFTLTGCNKDKVKKETLWGVYQEPVTPVKLPKDSGSRELVQLWKKDVGSGASLGFAILRPHYFQGSIYVADRSGDVSRFDSQTGSRIWRTELDTPVFSAIAVNENLAVVTHDNSGVTAMYADNGEIAWQKTIGRQISAVPTVGKGRVLIRTSDGLVIGLDASNGDIVWQVEKSVPGLSMHGDSTPVITGDAVLIGMPSGRLIANNVINGRDYWETEISFVRGQNELERLTDADTTPIIQGAKVYTAAYQGNVVALQIQSAAVIWRAKVSTRLPMAISENRLIVTGELGDVIALDADDGSILWEQDIFRGHGVSHPVVLDDRVIIGDANGKIHTLDVSSGALIQTRKSVSGAVIGIVTEESQFSVLSSEGDLSTYSFDRN
jgi:outer membrane protein assembly factor BamB